MIIYRVLEQETTKEIFELVIDTEIELIKLQEQNKILRESLEKISTDTIEVGFYFEPTWSAQIAREALANVNEKQSEE